MAATGHRRYERTAPFVSSLEPAMGRGSWERRFRVGPRVTAVSLVLTGGLLLASDGSTLVAIALVVIAWGVLRARRASLLVGCLLAAWSSAYGVTVGARAVVVAAVAAIVLLLVTRHELVGVLDERRRRLAAECA